MNAKNQRILNFEGPGEYDIYRGKANIERIFFQSCKLPPNRTFPVYVARVSETIRRGDFWLKHVRYPLFALEMTLDGKIEFRNEEQHDIAGPGALYLIPPGATVCLSSHNGEPVRRLCVLFAGENLKGILLTLNLLNSRMVQFDEPELIEKNCGI